MAGFLCQYLAFYLNCHPRADCVLLRSALIELEDDGKKEPGNDSVKKTSNKKAGIKSPFSVIVRRAKHDVTIFGR